MRTNEGDTLVMWVKAMMRVLSVMSGGGSGVSGGQSNVDDTVTF